MCPASSCLYTWLSSSFHIIVFKVLRKLRAKSWMKVAEDTGGKGRERESGKWQQQLRVDSCGTNARALSRRPQLQLRLSLCFCLCLCVPGSAAVSSFTPFDWCLPSRAADELNFSNEPTHPVKLMWIDVDVRRVANGFVKRGGETEGVRRVYRRTIAVQSQCQTHVFRRSIKGTCLRYQRPVMLTSCFPSRSASLSLSFSLRVLSYRYFAIVTLLTLSTDFLFKFA